MVLICAALALIGSLLIAVPVLAALGYVVVGLGVAPVFSTLLAWFTARFPVRAAPLMLTAGSLGGAVMPAVIGVLVARFGVQAVALTVAADAVLLGLLVVCGGSSSATDRSEPTGKLPECAAVSPFSYQNLILTIYV